jgi:hypothetical protein
MATPPITQRKVTLVVNGHYGHDAIVNFESDLPVALEDAMDAAGYHDAEAIIVFGRRRLNDYVGSPVWSQWEELERIIPAELV